MTDNEPKSTLTNPSADEVPKEKAQVKSQISSEAILKKIKALEPGMKGTYMSFFVLICAMVASIIAQNYVKTHYTSDSWTENCPDGYETACQANSAVYRFSFALVVLFALVFVGTAIYVPFFDDWWIVKIIIFIGVVIGFYNAAPHIFDDHGYAWFARFAAFFYVILQQIILIDFAYNVNEKLVSYADAEGEGKGTLWLTLILVSALLIFCASFAAIGIMFWQFLGCDSNAVILSLTIILTVLATILQLFFSEHGSILTSAIMAAYATYVCYSAVTLNPDSTCNPTISSSYQSVTTAIGLALTVISISWATYNAVKKIPGALLKEGPGLPSVNDEANSTSKINIPEMRIVLLEIATLFILVSAYYAMILTNWATLQQSDSISDPRNGRVALWLQAAAQWVAIVLYMWTLIAPKLFPDRDFS